MFLSLTKRQKPRAEDNKHLDIFEPKGRKKYLVICVHTDLVCEAFLNKQNKNPLDYK